MQNATRMRSVTSTVLLVLLAACVGEAPPDIDDPEWEDESEVEGIANDEAALNADMSAGFTIGAKLRVCGATGLNQRAGAGAEFAVQVIIPEDAEVTGLEQIDKWVKNDWNGTIGWSSTNYLCAVTAPPVGSPGTPPTASASESVQSPNAGKLRNAVRIGDHAGYVVAETGRAATYGTAETMFWLGAAFDHMLAEKPAAQRPQIRDISVQAGGRPAGAWPHSSHHSGRDVDITYPTASCDPTTGCLLVNVSATTIDATATWLLLETWLTNKVAYRIFIDSSLYPVLKTAARARGYTNAQLAQWFGPVIMHVSNHLNHLHVRFRCPADDRSCRL